MCIRDSSYPNHKRIPGMLRNPSVAFSRLAVLRFAADISIHTSQFWCSSNFVFYQCCVLPLWVSASLLLWYSSFIHCESYRLAVVFPCGSTICCSTASVFYRFGVAYLSLCYLLLALQIWHPIASAPPCFCWFGDPPYSIPCHR